ncbi:ArsR/SmtB family transcription factor [Streptomyces acidiscabies]|uniref:Winged helix-turn-helix domain-containing protein n=1 Tax=Streptomyces acidiscabies TaxID=42234 RepID=A0AAP6BAP2_9ACTN|nr:winged helix-turn-helix domain-containing protein [Streptomyces acidiscabies]MDX2961148.1 winged helix-turn-helix domain-containing protein [Streptomyces acidiscabies]MDX3022898.1 winged helix-turn-helix domain-containing protein [Streptomyces acidiscabies]MDX3791855.1 winged helix-turn-helix domain-containing protein [Streptomyces acidiscabies]GAQ59392.1 helix-turn-helix domain protein [Streptomyces acidiscabies]GAV46143.1 helix-turn-helix domain protein [Streptomyces acidiscabies]
MLRIHFTLTDLARTRLADAPSPLGVTAFSASRLVHRTGTSELDLWRRTVRTALKPSAPPLLSGLTPTSSSHPVPRFLRPQQGLHTLEEELDRLLATPRQELRADLEYVAQHRSLPGWARELADGDRAAAARLAQSIRDYHRIAVAPYWRGLASTIAADLAERARQLRHGGLEQVLSTLHPRMRWRPPHLEIEAPDDLDFHLGGRGLLLAPAAFMSYVPCDPDEERATEQPTLYYDVAGDGPPRALATGLHGPHGGLAALLGHSRAAVLEVIAEGASTSQLARRVGLSIASASEHATVLRHAGLVTTHRTGRTRHHSLTPLGAELLLHAAASPLPDRR